MTRRGIALPGTLALLCAAAVLAGGARASSAHSAANSQTFTDSTGENANAPDITTIVVSNDDAGNITFQVNISNRPALTPDMALFLYLDTDANPATGDPQNDGADYLLQLTPGSVDLYPWVTSDYGSSVQSPSLTYSYGTAGATIHVSDAVLGKSKQIDFFAIAVSGIVLDSSGNPDFSNAQADLAPDPGHGTYTYDVLTKLKLTSTALTATPKPARAGKPFTASFAATENDTAGPVTAGTVACTATVAGKHIPAARKGSVANGIATCTWPLPAKDKGKTIRGSVTLTVQGVSVSRAFTSKIT